MSLGRTRPTIFPLCIPCNQPMGGFQDAFVTKIAPSGSQLVYSSHLGGRQGDRGDGIAVDAGGHAYVFGETGSPDFPTTPGALDPVCGVDGRCDGSGDLFIAKVHAAGDSLVYATYLGGSGEERAGSGHGIAVGTDGSVYVTGLTLSADFPTTHGQLLNGAYDAVAIRLNPEGTALLYAVYLGGPGSDSGQAIAVDLMHHAYITGTTGGTFPTTSEIYTCADPGALVTKLRPDGSTAYALFLSWESLGKDRGQGIAVDPLGNAYVTGFTASPDFPLVNPVQPGLGGLSDAFVVKIADDVGSAVIARKYQDLGGPSGLLGGPVGPELVNPDGVGRRQYFQYGQLYQPYGDEQVDVILNLSRSMTTCNYGDPDCSQCVPQTFDQVNALFNGNRDASVRFTMHLDERISWLGGEHVQGVARLPDITINGHRRGGVVMSFNEGKGMELGYQPVATGREAFRYGSARFDSAFSVGVRAQLNHPGGIQAHGDLLVVAMEHDGDPVRPAQIQFVKFSETSGEIVNAFSLEGSQGEPHQATQSEAASAGFLKLNSGFSSSLCREQGTGHRESGSTRARIVRSIGGPRGTMWTSGSLHVSGAMEHVLRVLEADFLCLRVATETSTCWDLQARMGRQAKNTTQFNCTRYTNWIPVGCRSRSLSNTVAVLAYLAQQRSHCAGRAEPL